MPGVKSAIKNARNEMRRRMMHDHGVEPIWESYGLEDIRHVCLILSSPRSGSSVVMKKLREMPRVYFLQGEETPFYNLHGLNEFPDGKLDPEIPDETYRALSEDIISDSWVTMGNQSAYGRSLSHELWKTMIIGRLWMQLFSFLHQYSSYEDALDLMQRIQDSWLIDCNRICSGHPTEEMYYSKLMNSMHKHLYDLSGNYLPFYWDFTEDFISEFCPYASQPQGPITDNLIEEAPFVTVKPDALITERDICYHTFLIKNPTNCYRKEFIKSLYPNAEIKVIHLIRNPAATINGLIDGWHHHGFYSFNLSGMANLDILGYSNDTSPMHKYLWNFDLPPNWKDLTSARLEEVCAEQWFQAHGTILKDWKTDEDVEYKAVYLEDFLRSPGDRTDILNDLHCNLINREGVSYQPNPDLPQVMVTKKPQPARWRNRESIILNLLKDKNYIMDLAKELGYGDIDTWT